MTLSILDEKLLSRFYQEHNQLRDPKYFSVFRPNSKDLALLEEAMEVRIILLQPRENDNFIKLHDRRIFDATRGAAVDRVIYFVLETAGKEKLLYKANEDFKFYRPLTSESWMIKKTAHCNGYVFKRLIIHLFEMHFLKPNDGC